MYSNIHLLFLSSTLLPFAASHYTFGHLLVNDTETPEWKYVRDVTIGDDHEGTGYPDSSKEFRKTIPYVPTWGGNDYALRCGVDSWYFANTTETATVLAGTRIGFRILHEHVDGAYTGINHPGPASIYMSRSDDLANYIGEGEWFKIGYEGPINDTKWSTQIPTPGHEYRVDVNVTVPLKTPPGTYLLRMEHFMPTGSIYSLGYSQWFVNCAHVNIVGPGGGVPGPMTRFPEAYNGTIDASINLQYPGAKNEFEGIANYPEPGAARWNGE